MVNMKVNPQVNKEVNMEVGLLTYRLSDFMNQISANQMEEIVNKQRMHNERFMSQGKVLGMGSYNKSDFENDAKKARTASNKNIGSLKKRDKENQQPCNQEEKIIQQNKFGMVWSASNSFKSITDRDADSMNKETTLDKAVVVPKKNAFMRAAKLANSLKRCTCSSLDSKCYIHDS